ncbi:hypothetical protein RvVAR0630_pl06720 (plasmid) [Agrobacterium vitis]|uniref:hypothetical protein n=1 Tax=Agrobacterium vitis TaxID=373 RepID=UPI0015D7E820|nr:hypothetical protein [Agrobacterium vitis]BCH62530.1 hypothetical protein RvVAR0630_pl06720 [Agrobacterium vitis]
MVQKRVSYAKIIYARIVSEYNKSTPPKETLAVARGIFDKQFQADECRKKIMEDRKSVDIHAVEKNIKQ